ncbi:HPr family phosphocarrier protein [Pectinatus frisingensis]|uniref:HPr family phosphocarrier protein n=1 Tax=Pectinatus frisingensis TaxID=865 RepID=UPI0018C801FD|nr:HPr family phosphocarrier protein [Pectinatus frisingensis]
MITHKLLIKNPFGLHAAYAAELANAARKYKSVIYLRKNHKLANAKDMVAILGLLVKSGDELEILADGSEEAKDIEEFIKLIHSLDR